MTGESSKPAESIASPLISSLAFGVIGAALVFYGRRANPGILTTLATTAGYGMVTKAVSAAVFAVL